MKEGRVPTLVIRRRPPGRLRRRAAMKEGRVPTLVWFWHCSYPCWFWAAMKEGRVPTLVSEAAAAVRRPAEPQ